MELITTTQLASTGIEVPDDQLQPLLDYMNNVLQERVGEAVVELLGDEELEELATLQETASDTEVHDWIQAHVSDLADVVQDEIDILLGEASEQQKAFSAQ